MSAKNDRRAARSARALADYVAPPEAPGSCDDPGGPVVDLLTDLMHYCDRRRVNFAELLGEAFDFYDGEAGAATGRARAALEWPAHELN